MNPDQPHAPDATPAHLPALLPPTTTLLRRTQTTLELLRDVVQESSAEYWYERGKAAMAAEKWDEASHSFVQNLKLEAFNWRGQLQLAVVALKSLQNESIVIALITAYKTCRSTWDVFTSELTTEEWQIFLHRLEEYKNLGSSSLETLLGLALVYRANNQHKQAQLTLDVAFFLHPKEVKNSASFYRLSGWLWLEAGKQAEALRDFNMYVAISPDDSLAYISLGRVKRETENYIGALSDYDRAIQLDSNHALIYCMRASLKSVMNDLVGEIEDYNKAIQLDPYCETAFYNRSIARRHLEDFTGSLEDCSQTIHLEPNDPTNHHNRGVTKSIMNDDAGALIDFNRAIELDSNNSASYYGRGNAKASLNDTDGALMDYNRAIELAPNNADAYFNRGCMRYNLNDFNGALTDFNYVISLEPENAEAYRDRALIKEMLGDNKGAIADRKVVEDNML